MSDYDVYSDEDSSIGPPPPPPPPPPADLPKGPAPPPILPTPPSPEFTPKSRHPYEDRLKVFDGTANFNSSNDEHYVGEYEETDFIMDHNFESDEKNADVVPTHSRLNRDGGDGSRKPAMFAAIAGCLLVVVVIGLGWGFGTGSFLQGKSQKEGVSPVDRNEGGFEDGGRPTAARGGRMYDYLSEVVVRGKDAFANPSSPEGKALAWLVDEDPLKLDPADPSNMWRINQRFALATLWYTSVFEWFEQTNWLETENECDWYGIECAVLEPNVRRRSLQDEEGEESEGGALEGEELEGQVELEQQKDFLSEKITEARIVVTTLNLEGNNLQGNIPSDLHLLRYLIVLNLSKNQLVGSIPRTFEELVFLEELYLDSNTLEGDLESFIFPAIQNLQVLDLSHNQFSGRLENLSLWSTTTIETIVLDNNQFTGGLSPLIANLQFLSKFAMVDGR